MSGEWVVLLEVAGDAALGPIDAGDVRRLREVLGPGSHGGALHCPDRYALQLTVTAANPVEALLDVVARWTDTARELGLPAWQLVRTEVFTPEDLRQEFEMAHGEESVQRSEAYRVSDDGDQVGLELLHRAFSDPVTGLLAHAAFDHRLEASLEASDDRWAVAVVCLGVEGFHGVNDRFDAKSADDVLIALGQRLAATLRTRDVLSRLWGGEYGVLLDDSTEEAALTVAERMVDAVRLPMTVCGHDITLSASAGVAVSQPGESAESLVANALSALSTAASTGGGRAVLYGSDVSRPHQMRRDVISPAVQDRRSHLQLLQQAAVAAKEADTLDQAAQVVTRRICTQIGCAVGHLWVSPESSPQRPETPLWHAADGEDHRALLVAAEKLVTDTGVGLAGRVMATGRPVWIADLADDDKVSAYNQAAITGLRSAFALPVVVEREVVAVLAFFSRTRMEPAGSFLDVLTGIGTQLGRVVERQRAAEALRRSAEQLRASEARLREAEALSRLGSWHFDLRTGAGSWSEGTGALYGLDPQQPLDLGSALAAVHVDDRSRVEAALSLLVEHGASFSDEIRVVRPDGQVRWHRAQGAAIRDCDGVVVAIQGTSQDITEAKLAHEALRDRERQLAEAQRAARLGCWELELSSGQLTWSEEMYRLWGWEPDQEVTLEAFLATVHPDDRRLLLEEEARLNVTGEPSLVDFRATVADGRERWFRGGAHMLFDEEGRAVKLFGTDQDITEQKQAEQQLRRTNALYQRILETSHEGIVTVDAQHSITFVNSRMAQILGYSVEEMTGLRASAFVTEEHRAVLATHIQRRRQGMSDHYPTQLQTKDGSLVHVLISASPLMDENGDYAGALAMVTDITAVKEAEDIVRSQSLGTRAKEGTGLGDESAFL